MLTSFLRSAHLVLTCHSVLPQVNCEVNLSHSGKSDVYVTGYTTHQFMSIDSSDEEGEESSDDEDLALRGAGLANGMPARAAIAQVGLSGSLAYGSDVFSPVHIVAGRIATMVSLPPRAPAILTVCLC